jgi:cytochrome c oxidase assembly protein subunit 11
MSRADQKSGYLGVFVRDWGVLALCVFLLGLPTVGVIYSPTLYRLFCAATGYNGATQRATTTAKPQAVAGETFTVGFDANVAPGLKWEFRPEQQSVQVEVGKPVTIYYYAKNLSDKPVVAHAVFNVTPYQVAPYFFKIQCFCFTDEKLGPGEEAHMPVLFYLDKEMLKDNQAMALKRVTLSYTFYGQGDEPGKIADARDLSAGSTKEAATIDSGAQTEFTNDAPRK